jgi:uncharacterized protein YmfQ (DUF2313 family)
MPLLNYSAEDYLAQFQRLLPRGRVWNRGLELIQDFELLVLMPAWSRLQAALNTLIPDFFPCTTDNLLPEWAETLGLPNDCTGPLSKQELKLAVCAKFTARGGQSKEYFIAVAKALGYTITITEYAPFRCGINRCGDGNLGDQWAFVWKITAQSPMIYFLVGQSTARERLRYWGDPLLECTLEAIAPAHTILIFAYQIVGTP